MSRIYRPDIDGLRAVAVVCVVAYHAFPQQFGGGFIGVDIFFVISGFLISSILLDQVAEGRLAVADFYGRRIRRIFPALLVVLLASLVFGWRVLFPEEFAGLLRHGAAGAGFVANLALWSESGYFDRGAGTKPLLHLWSLGIEEQFYIAWPLLLWLGWKARLPLALVLSVLLLASFALNVAGLLSDRVATFYSPQTRAWELLLGAVLAHQVRTRPAPAGWPPRHALALAGVTLVAFGLWRLGQDKDLLFPGFWALAPTVGTLLLIAAGEAAWFNRVVLSARPLVWLGLISFPLYLWHWPLLSFAQIVAGRMPSAGMRIVLVAVAVVLAGLTWRLVEQPFRRGPHAGRKTVLLMLLMVLTGVGSYVGWQWRVEPYLQGTGWLAENLAQFNAVPMNAERASCLARFPGHEGTCLASRALAAGAKPEFVFIGDSHSAALARGFIVANPGRAVLALGKVGCPPLPGVEQFDADGPLGCTDVYTGFLAGLRDGHFRDAVVVVSARHAYYVNGAGFGDIDARSLQRSDSVHMQPAGPRLPRAAVDYGAVYRDGLRQLLATLLPHVRLVVFSHQVPELGFYPERCLERWAGLQVPSCAVPRDTVLVRQQAYREAAGRVLGEFPSVIVADPLDTFCDERACRPVRAGMMMYFDDDHLGLLGAAAYANAIIDCLP